MTQILSIEQSYKADQLAIKAGVPSKVLMENAGVVVAAEIHERFKKQPVLVLCGPGNNGGDGFVVARTLKRRGWPVSVALVGKMAALKGDALIMARQWRGSVEALTPQVFADQGLVVDALFGVGLTRAIEGELAELIAVINASAAAVVAVDIASGVDGDSGAVLGGAVLGTAVQADLTITFSSPKLGHYLLPGRALCGELVVADIGIPKSALEQIGPAAAVLNAPELWLDRFPVPDLRDHKYDRGHGLVVSGGLTTTGASQLGAMAALRAGAGLVSVASPREALGVHAAQLTSIMLILCDTPQELRHILEDRRKNAVLIGPGAGVGAATRELVKAVLDSGAAAVVDADGLTSFEENPQELFDAIGKNPNRPVILTPHEGEFTRLFGNAVAASLNKPDRAIKAAELSGAVMVVKGADTVIANHGQAVINDNAPADLASAGSGDVLAGILTGLLAQAAKTGMDGFRAGCCGVYMHGAAGAALGPGLIAEELPHALPDVIRDLRVLRG